MIFRADSGPSEPEGLIYTVSRSRLASIIPPPLQDDTRSRDKHEGRR